jgi:WD40 repeat protein
VITFFEVISTSAPHIYHSALLLSPRESIVHKLHKEFFRPLLRVVRGPPTSWEPVVATAACGTPAHPKFAWSSCSKFIAVSLYGMIGILDAVTLERLHTFAHHMTEEVRWLSFSPDSHSLAHCCAGEHGLITWDLQTGGRIGHITPTSNPHSAQYFSSTYSVDGTMFAVAYRNRNEDYTTFTAISTYNLVSGTHIYSHRAPEGRIVPSIWTHGECLRFATVKPGSITIWEVGFTSIHTLAKVESLPGPDDIGRGEDLFLPTRSRLAFTLHDTVLVWDARDSRFLLNFVGGDWNSSGISFSSDGRFFACRTASREIYLWKESPTGYALHRNLATSPNGIPLFSSNGKSIIAYTDPTIQLWHTTDPMTSLPTVPTQPASKIDFILAFSPDKSLAATARLRDNVAIIIDLKSGDPRLIVDTGMEICGLGVTGNNVIVVGDKKIITWDVPARDCVPDTKANIHDSVRTVVLDHPAVPRTRILSASISPDFDYIAIGWEGHGGLGIYDRSTGKHLAGIINRELLGRPWFTPDGHEVWPLTNTNGFGWEIIKNEKSDVIRLDPIFFDERPLGKYPWDAPHGHYIMAGAWIFDSRKKRLMWMPYPWRVGEKRTLMWAGRFLALLDGRLSEAVILS